MRARLWHTLLAASAAAGCFVDVGSASEADATTQGSTAGSSETTSASSTTSSTSDATSVTTAATSEATSEATIEPGTSTTTTTGTGPSETTSESCLCDVGEVCTPEGCRGGQIFLNFDGPTMQMGPEDATIDQTSIAQLAGPTQGYGGTEEDRAALVDAVRDRYAGVSVYITSERPQGPPYSMVVLGPNLDDFGGALHISTLDCGDQIPNSVGFAALHIEDGLSLDERAMVTAHTAAHAVGLEHVEHPDAIMAATVSPDAVFVDSCEPVPQSLCAHPDCPNGTQSSLGELIARFGPL